MREQERRRRKEELARLRGEAQSLRKDPFATRPSMLRSLLGRPQGWSGQDSGRWGVIDAPKEWRGTSNQVCGLWPWVVGAGAPTLGTYIGDHLLTAAPVCFDPLTWFHVGKLINNPSAFVLGLPGLGKSSLVRKVVTGAVAQGVTPLVLGDKKPDYGDQVRAFGGQVINLSRGEGHLNPLDPGALGSIIPILAAHGLEREATRVKARMQAQRVNLVSALLTIIRRSPITETDEAMLVRAIDMLDSDPRFADRAPLLQDLIDLLHREDHTDLWDLAEAESKEEFWAAVKPLRSSLKALLQGALGDVFAHHTTHPIDVDSVGVCVDVSGIPDTDSRLLAAVMLAVWACGFDAVEAAHTLADNGLGPQRHFLVVMDELWQVLGAGPGMVEKVDALTRLNRTLGLSLMLISHTPKDLDALRDPVDVAKALGFIERAGVLICGGLPDSDLERLEGVVHFTNVEKGMVSAWSTPPTWDADRGVERPPPGRGRFLLKIGHRPGIPVVTKFTGAEFKSDIHNTNKRFDNLRTGADAS
ncbi:hypothetical protein ONR57_08900 [Hoyosella sp. YIM 151337]|uniref:hypothetical protein n=1 Tax=Hoyosella sp. YIM 151337 TaxID=2992742 RepID=UPI002235ADEF|nr:hypothetical protein [Hoyosella sp. YIM 151337]MCW4353413.1 hypothetical protein [Hoyosella sp. YIM 151337]